MLQNFLKEVVVLVVGKPFEIVAGLLDSKKHVNEFIIAKKMDITINQTRNILYKLSDQGLVSSMRKKDKRKGWYTYFWKFENIKCLEFLKLILVKKLEQLDLMIKSRETKQFYICKRCNVEFNEENALLKDFTCNECGDIFTMKDNEKVLREFKKRHSRLEKELELVDEEIVKEREKLDKIKDKRIKKEIKEKATKRRETAAAKKKLAKKDLAKANKLIRKKADNRKENKVKKQKLLKNKISKKKAKKKSTVRSTQSSNRKKKAKKKSTVRSTQSSNRKKPLKKKIAKKIAKKKIKKKLVKRKK